MKLNAIENILLASNSPRRRELLGLAGVPFFVWATDVNEDVYAEENPDHYVLRLAARKAQAAAGGGPAGALVLAADTTVVLDGEILGKPADAAEARDMLRRLRGRSHLVYSGIALLIDGKLTSDMAVTEVPMRAYRDEEIDAYVASGDPYDKAGGYAIQHSGFHPVEQMAGCFANVVGLPLCHLWRTLQREGFSLRVDLAQACQEHLGYDCPVYRKILQWEL